MWHSGVSKRAEHHPYKEKWWLRKLPFVLLYGEPMMFVCAGMWLAEVVACCHETSLTPSLVLLDNPVVMTVTFVLCNPNSRKLCPLAVSQSSKL